MQVGAGVEVSRIDVRGSPCTGQDQTGAGKQRCGKTLHVEQAPSDDFNGGGTILRSSAALNVGTGFSIVAAVAALAAQRIDFFQAMSIPVEHGDAFARDVLVR